MSLLQERTVTIEGIFAEDALTDIPQQPTPGISYRNTALSSTVIAEGWPFKEIVNSSDLNQVLYVQTSLQKMNEQYGFLIWSSQTEYKAGGVCLGLDGTLYQAITDNTAQNPSTSPGYWRKFTLGLSQSIGTVFYSMRTDTPEGAIACDGSIYDRTTFPDFYDSFLSTGKIITKTFKQYEADIANNGSCAFFGIDTATKRFRAPTLKDVFLRATVGSSMVGLYQGDAIRNITGSLEGGHNTTYFSASSGAFYRSSDGYADSAASSGSSGRPRTAYFDASRVVPTANENRPKNIRYRAFVTVYTGVELSTAQGEAFVETVNNIYKELGNINAILDEINGEVF